MARKSKRLPSKPSALIRLALDDLTAAEKDPRYVINMDDWHHPNVGTMQCEVCLAGAVMAKTLNVPIASEKVPSNLYHAGRGGEAIVRRLHALNDFRSGDLSSAFANLNIVQRSEALKLVERYGAPNPLPAYKDDRAKFKRFMRTMANRLEKIGL